MKFSNISSKLKGKKLKNSSKKLKVSANPLGLLAENRSNKKACSRQTINRNNNDVFTASKSWCVCVQNSRDNLISSTSGGSQFKSAILHQSRQLSSLLCVPSGGGANITQLAWYFFEIPKNYQLFQSQQSKKIVIPFMQ